MARSTSLMMMIQNTYIIYFLGGSDMSSKVRCKPLTKNKYTPRKGIKS